MLTYFIDDVFAQGRYGFASRWHENRLGYVTDGLAGDEAFFDYLDVAIRKPPSETLSVSQVACPLAASGGRPLAALLAAAGAAGDVR